MIKQLNLAYGRMEYEVSRNQIKDNIYQSPAKVLAKTIPKSVDIITQLLRDDRALLGLLNMFKDKKKLTYFFIANVLTIILGFILTRLASKKGSIFKRFSKWILRKTFIYGIRFYILIFFFGTELSPTFSIFQNVFSD